MYHVEQTIAAVGPTSMISKLQMLRVRAHLHQCQED